jgi:hypothetical protein
MDTITRPSTAKVTPTSETFLPSKHHARKQIIPTRKFAESSTSPPPTTYRLSPATSKPNDGKLSKTSRSAAGHPQKRKSTIHDFAFIENLSRNSRESAPSPEPSPPLGTRVKGAKITATSSMDSTALNKGSRALTSKKETKQQIKDIPAKFTRSKGKVDIAQLPVTNKAMTAKAFPKAKYAPKLAGSGMTRTKISKPKDTKEVAKTNGHPKAVAPATSQTTVAQSTVLVPSNFKPKKRLVAEWFIHILVADISQDSFCKTVE